MHPSLNAQIDIASYRTETYARSSIQSCSPIEAGNTSADRARALRIGERAIYAWLYPNFMLNRYGPCLDINHVVPLGPTRCRVDYEFFFDPDSLGDTASAQAFIKQSIEQSDLTQQEDVAICESVQVGLASASYDRGRYAPQVEQGEHHFHCLLSEDYHRALDPPPAP
jgi:choline monooxygenase